MKPANVRGRRTPGAKITPGGAIGGDGPAIYRLEIPSGPAGRFRLAQLDDYTGLKRAAYPWSPPVELVLRAKAGSPDIPGTWGFGFWNAPGSFTLGLGSASALPALPNAAWFFHASRRSFLSFRDDLPGFGFRAQTFRSPPASAGKFATAAAAAPLLIFPAAARRIRRYLSRELIEESGEPLAAIDVTEEHEYRLEWLAGKVRFEIDRRPVLETEIAPCAPMALVIWIDNQFASFPPDGRLRYGMHPSAEGHWLEIADARINGAPIELVGLGNGFTG